jgi:hypothetical protein
MILRGSSRRSGISGEVDLAHAGDELFHDTPIGERAGEMS